MHCLIYVCAEYNKWSLWSSPNLLNLAAFQPILSVIKFIYWGTNMWDTGRVAAVYMQYGFLWMGSPYKADLVSLLILASIICNVRWELKGGIFEWKPEDALVQEWTASFLSKFWFLSSVWGDDFYTGIPDRTLSRNLRKPLKIRHWISSWWMDRNLSLKEAGGNTVWIPIQ